MLRKWNWYNKYKIVNHSMKPLIKPQHEKEPKEPFQRYSKQRLTAVQLDPKGPTNSHIPPRPFHQIGWELNITQMSRLWTSPLAHSGVWKLVSRISASSAV